MNVLLSTSIQFTSLCCGLGFVMAQDVPTAPAIDSAVNDASIKGLKNARVISLAIPAPRGQILDREGSPMAQNRVSFQVALQYPQFENATQDFVVTWGRKRMDELKLLLPKSGDKSDDELWAHYKDRRWLPLYLTGSISGTVAESLSQKLDKRDDLILVPVYSRYYPGATLASHIIGYTGSAGKLPTGPINFNDPLWEHTEGKSGLELLYDKQLAGTPGMKRILYNNDGVKLQEEIMRRPIAGGNIVTTINKRWQERAEKVLKEGCQRGAMVVLDVTTGEVLVMASRPSFDLMEFVGGISTARFKALNEDPAAPLFARAFSAQYPPASTFKAVVGLAALQAGTIEENTAIYAPAFLQFPGHKVRNASGREEGHIAVKYAMARSCNTWFAQVGINTGPTNFLAMARTLGYGEKTGLPLVGEAPGLIPTNEWMISHHKRRFMNGDSANMSIGQGVLLATPLQVAQGMAGIANGQVLPKLQLIHQVQDGRGRVITQSMPEARTQLGSSEEDVLAIHKGMRDVVHEGYGTGRAARLSWTTMCGKTGTAQWGPPSKNQRLAWFAGYFPFENPRFAYAVVYEGKPGQVVSGGRMAAPMVQAFFNPLRKEIEDIITPPKRALLVVDEDSSNLPDPGTILRAVPVDVEEGEQADGVPKAVPLPDDSGLPALDEDGNAIPPPTLPEDDDDSEQPEGEIRRAIPIDEEDEETGDEIEITPE
jgi:penicillin-binding protein 2